IEEGAGEGVEILGAADEDGAEGEEEVGWVGDVDLGEGAGGVEEVAGRGGQAGGAQGSGKVGQVAGEGVDGGSRSGKGFGVAPRFVWRAGRGHSSLAGVAGSGSVAGR